MGDMLCPEPPSQCECKDNRDRGGVVVRWRIADASIGQLLSRGQCCCNPDPTATGLLAQQCSDPQPGSCLDAPAWLVRNVQLHIRSVAMNGTRPAVDCTITAPCLDGELTTQYCLEAGAYDLQLRADIEIVSKQYNQFVCSNTQTLSPPIVRRTVRPGQAVNLDGIVLGVNAPPVSSPPDGGTTD